MMLSPILYMNMTKRSSDQIHHDVESKSENEINQIDKYEESHSDYESDTSTILDYKDDISQNLLESNDESDIDYSYAKVATHKKPSVIAVNVNGSLKSDHGNFTAAEQKIKNEESSYGGIEIDTKKDEM